MLMTKILTIRNKIPTMGIFVISIKMTFPE